MSTKYILKGHKVIPLIDVIEWSKWFGTADRTIKQETLSDGKWVSTVFLGLDHNLGFSKKPLLFETMVFKSKDELDELDVERYSTYLEAEEGHKNMVKKYLLTSNRKEDINKDLRRRMKKIIEIFITIGISMCARIIDGFLIGIGILLLLRFLI